MSFHRIEASKDPKLLVGPGSTATSGSSSTSSAPASRSSTSAHHDDAYRWAERRRMEVHPATGALQIVEVRERVVEIATAGAGRSLRAQVRLRRTRAPLRRARSRRAPDHRRARGLDHGRARRRRGPVSSPLRLICRRRPPRPCSSSPRPARCRARRPPSPTRSPTPDTQRRFRVMEGADELRAALDAPFETVGDLPASEPTRALVERVWNGPVRVVGSAGTGKTVVALHRVRHLLGGDPKGRVLLTTFSTPLAEALSTKTRPPARGSTGLARARHRCVL